MLYIYNSWYPLSLSYGVILPSSLTKVLPRVLGFSPRLPVSVYGTGISSLDSAFSWQRGICDFTTCFSLLIMSRSYVEADLPTSTSYSLERALPFARFTYPSASTLLSIAWDSTGFSTCCPSLTPFGLGLGPDLPWVDEPSPGTLWLSTGEILTHLFATHASILACVRSNSPYSLSSLLTQRSSTMRLRASTASVLDFSPVYLRRITTWPVSYYALFKCVAASKPTSWLSE